MLSPPKRWSNHFRDARTDAWRTEPRQYQPNPGWRALRSGTASGRAIVANLETLLAAAGTPYFPDLTRSILVVEDWNGSLGAEERAFRQLERIGVFDVIAGLVVGKPERFDQNDAPFTLDDLVLEIAGPTAMVPDRHELRLRTHPPDAHDRANDRNHAERRAGVRLEILIEEPMVTGR